MPPFATSIACCLLSAVCLSAHVDAATLFVTADGSGDYPTIQDAVDAASPGDVIELGAGLFDDFTPGTDWPYHDYYVVVETDDLTFRGQGIDVTVIGQEISDVHPEQTTVILVASGLDLHLQDLTIRLQDRTWNRLLSVRNSDLTVERCAFRDASYGIRQSGAGSGIEIVDCQFSDLADAVLAHVDSPSLIANCTFERVVKGLYHSGPGDLVVKECTFDGDQSGGNSCGVYTVPNGVVTLRNCRFKNHTRAALLIDGAIFRLHDCEIHETSGHGIELARGILTGTGNTIYSETRTLMVGHAQAEGFHDNSLLTGVTGLIVEVWAENGSAWPDLNLEHNWWGTSDPHAIAHKIWDAHDDWDLDMIVDYRPFKGELVAVEPWSLSNLRSLFR